MNGSPSATRQPKQARAIRTRERILEQAEVAFASKGFEATSLTSDILEPAGVSVGSFYHQFPDKRAVLEAVVGERRSAWGSQIHELLDAEQHDTLERVLRDVLRWLLDDIELRPSAWWVHFREVHHADPEIRALLESEWFAWAETVTRLASRWAPDQASLGIGSTTFLASGLAGFVRRYLAADAAERAELRGNGVDETVQVFAAALSSPR